MNDVLKKYSKDICSGTLANEFEVVIIDNMQDVELNGENIKLKLEKV